jgi:hypothetical protein
MPVGLSEVRTAFHLADTFSLGQLRTNYGDVDLRYWRSDGHRLAVAE